MLRNTLTDTLAILAAATTLGLDFIIWQKPAFTFREPAFTLVAIGALCLIAVSRRVPVAAWIFWFAGGLTLAWSLAPGNTMVYQLWEALSITALAAGSWRLGLWMLNIILLGDGLLDALALNAFGLQTYISGSVHYMLGAQALLVLPLALGYYFVEKRLSTKIGLALLSIASIYAALMSGARAVYLPLVIVLGLGCARLLRQGHRWYRVVGVAIAIGLVIIAADYRIPGRPVAAALGTKASVTAQVNATESHGVATQRLRFWDQTMSIALDRPMGAGTGSYQSVIHAYQKYPMLWSNSPHNIFVETVATGGWLRLILLLVLVGVPIVRGWRSDDWPYALGAFGIWTTMAFDVTSYYPSFLMLAFASLGPLYGRRKLPTITSPDRPATELARHRFRRWLRVAGIGSILALIAWWYVPCDGPMCAVTRYLGFQPRVDVALDNASPAQRDAILQVVRRLYPKSLWVVREEQRFASANEERLALAREVATRFPNQSPQNFLDWAEAAMTMGKAKEASHALREGLDVFPADEYPFGEVRVTPESYQAWIDTATSLLESLQR